MSEITTYTDPLIALLKDPDLNKSKEKTTELIRFIDEIDDQTIRNYCVESFEILCDLEMISNKINNWDFKTLDFKISQSMFLNEEDVKKRKFNSEISKRVIGTCLILHKELSQISVEIDELNHYSRYLSPLQRISDPGTILIELIIRNIKLKNQLNDNISIHYSKSRLVNIGIDLENLIEDKESKNQKSSISEETVESYKNFINTLLQQLNDAIADNDTIGIMECISVVNDVEKMFETMKNEDIEIDNENESEEEDIESKVDLDSEDTLFDDIDDDQKSLSTSKIINKRRKLRNNKEGNWKINEKKASSLNHGSITEALPYLMGAFEEAKNAEEELREVISRGSPMKKQQQQQKNSRSRSSTSSSTTVHEDNVPKVKSKLSQDLLKEFEKEPIEKIHTMQTYFNNNNNKNNNTNSIIYPNILNSTILPFMKPIMTQSNELIIDKPILKHQENINKEIVKTKELELSPKKLQKIKVGDGRVKETVKEIETQLKQTFVVPPTPTTPQQSTFSNSYNSNFGFGFGKFWGVNNTNTNTNNINKQITKNEDYSFHDIDNLID